MTIRNTYALIEDIQAAISHVRALWREGERASDEWFEAMDELQDMFNGLAHDLWPEIWSAYNSRSETGVLVLTEYGAAACLAGAACYAADAGLFLLGSRERCAGFWSPDQFKYYEDLTAPLVVAERALAVARMILASKPAPR